MKQKVTMVYTYPIHRLHDYIQEMIDKGAEIIQVLSTGRSTGKYPDYLIIYKE